MPKFIKLNTIGNYTKIHLINTNYIVCIQPHPYFENGIRKEGTGIQNTIAEYGYTVYKESFEEVEKLINA